MKNKNCESCQSGKCAEHSYERGVTIRKSFKPIGRNERCPCGSGLKFKNCHHVNQTQNNQLVGLSLENLQAIT